MISSMAPAGAPRKVLFILSELLDEDVDWLSSVGDRLRYPVGAELIAYGAQVDSIYFVLDGTFSVLAANGYVVAQLGSGEVIGEMSLVDPARSTACVLAGEGASALRVSHARLREKLETDAPFAARFYRALAIFMSTRMRQTTRMFGYAGMSQPSTVPVDEINEALLQKSHLASMRFERMLRRMAS